MNGPVQTASLSMKKSLNGHGMISAAEWELSRQDTETQTDNIQIFVDEHL